MTNASPLSAREATRQKIAQARAEGGVLREAIVRGHGCCLLNDPEFDQGLWDEALVQATELASLKRDIELWAGETYDSGIAERMRERIAP